MEISYEKHGVEGIENCLSYLANSDADYIDGDEFEIIGEDEEGREGSADISIVNLAEEACKALAAQRKRIAQLEAAEEVQIALRQKADEREAALAANRAKGTLLMQRVFQCNDYSASGEGEGTSDGLLLPMELVEELAEFSDESPNETLARRDKIQRAEEIESTAADLKESWPQHNGKYYWLIGRAHGLRQQANQC